MTAVVEESAPGTGHGNTAAERDHTLILITLRIRRFDPETDAEPYWQDFQVEADPTERILTAMMKIKAEQDGSLTFRRSLRARHLRLGRDAHQRPQPAGVQDPGQGLGHVQADHGRGHQGPQAGEGPRRRHGPVHAGVQGRDAVPHHDRQTSRRGNASSPPRTASASTTPPSASCARRAPLRAPCSGATASYFGPAAIVNAHRFIFDSRDEGAEERLEILNEKEGVWRCRTTFNCTDACPRGIEVTKAIQEVKRALIFRRV